MNGFELDRLDREVDALLADVKGLLDEDGVPEAELPADSAAASAEPDSAPQSPQPDPDATMIFRPGQPDDADATIIFRPLTAYEQSKPAYQTAKRAEYEREREAQRQARQKERLRQEEEEERMVREMEQSRKKRRRDAPSDPEAYSEWLYQQGEDPESQLHRETVAQQAAQAPSGRTPKKTKKKRGGALWRVLAVLLVLLAMGAGFVHFIWAKQPKADDGGLGARRKGCSTILLAGTDEGGYRTDTMMLLSVDRSAKRLSLVSIPRDTLVYCQYSVPKLNSAYGWAGGGDAGMQELLTRVTEITGFHPDGYVVVDLDCFTQLVDLMGGVTFDVPVDMHYSDPSQGLSIDLSAGEQKLDGAQAMQLVRFRSGYADADLGRVRVQRDFVSAALHQWATLLNVYRLPQAVQLVRQYTQTDLSEQNLVWLAESVLLCGTDNMTMDTLPGAAAWIGGGSYYVLDAEKTASLVNELLNPYQNGVTAADLSIRVG